MNKTVLNNIFFKKRHNIVIIIFIFLYFTFYPDAKLQNNPKSIALMEELLSITKHVTEKSFIKGNIFNKPDFTRGVIRIEHTYSIKNKEIFIKEIEATAKQLYYIPEDSQAAKNYLLIMLNSKNPNKSLSIYETTNKNLVLTLREVYFND